MVPRKPSRSASQFSRAAAPLIQLPIGIYHPLVKIGYNGSDKPIEPRRLGYFVSAELLSRLEFSQRSLQEHRGNMQQSV